MEITIAIITALIGNILAYETTVVIAFDAAGEFTSGRVRSLVGVAVALASVIVGWLAKSQARAGGGVRGAAIAALILGLVGFVFSAVHLAGSTGFGTGGGRAGAIVGLVLTVVGTILGGRALTNSRQVQGMESGDDPTEARN